ncbi:ATP-binding protein [Spirochaeta dissipatitropha]
MRSRRASGASLTGIASLVLMYVFAAAVVLLLARRVLTDVTFLGTAPSIFLIILVIVFPVGLLILVIIHLVRLLQDRLNRRPGSGLRLRFLFAAVCIVLLSAIPQGIMSITFMASAMETWFNPESFEAVRGGLTISLGYYRERVEDLESFSGNSLVQSVLLTAPQNPGRAWENLQMFSPRLDAFQLFDSRGNTLYHGGEANLRIREGQVRPGGVVAKESSGNRAFLRIMIPAGLDGSHQAMLAVYLPEGFDQNAENLTRVLETFAQVELFQPLFLIGVTIFYLAFAVPLILLAVLVSFTLSDVIMRPIESLEEATRRVAAGDYSYRILTSTGGDISHLVDSFNRMIQELDDTRRKIRQTEKVAAWQEIAQRLAHEIKNPLTPIRLSAERMLVKYRRAEMDGNVEEVFPEVLERSVDSIVREVNALSEMLTEFRNFSTLPKPTLRPTLLREVLDRVQALYQNTGSVDVSYSAIPEDFSIPADSGMLHRVFSNLWQNAVEAMDGKGSIIFKVDVVQKGRRRYARIQMQDTGPGISETDQQKVFHPYFTTKTHGTGLGLAIVERIVFDHDGAIWFETSEGDGTTFFLELPME